MTIRWHETNRAPLNGGSDRRRDYGPKGCAEDFTLLAGALALLLISACTPTPATRQLSPSTAMSCDEPTPTCEARR